jgi:putative SOS response-associated peptidase YedK
MCYHYSFSQPLPDGDSMEWEMPFEPVYHASGFDFPLMPVITMQEPARVQAYSWGLIPEWVRSGEDAQKLRAQTLNAKGETVFEKPAFRAAVPGQRCLVPADGFFEWMDFQRQKYPHFVRLKAREVFAFAGLYAHWANKETGELIRSFTIITTSANPLMERIHNVKKRMPVVLPQPLWQEWLYPKLDVPQIRHLLQPCSDGMMEAFPISKRITTRGLDTNVPEVTQRVDYPELAFA